MATKAKKKIASVQTNNNSPQKTRLWLMYPPRMITNPVIWELSQRFKVIPNVRQASVTDEIGIVCLELEGRRTDIKAAIKWLEKTGINVEPVEINVIES
jgi:L-aspartate semialdehyde sulfurtransferase ferredoxin